MSQRCAERGGENGSRLQRPALVPRGGSRPLQRPSWCSPGTARVGPERRTWPASWCCAEPAETSSRSSGTRRPLSRGGRRGGSHQGVVQADVSLQAALLVFKLHDRHFGGCDGQDVPQTCRVSSRASDWQQQPWCFDGDLHSPVCFFRTFASPSMISLQFSFC